MKFLQRQSPSLRVITPEDTLYQLNKRAFDRNHHRMIAGGFGYSSGHVLINHERCQLGRATLKRSAELDQLCQKHAEKMARTLTVTHSVNSLAELQDLLRASKVGQNVQSGKCVKIMHREAFKAKEAAYLNMVSENFVEFGTATAKGSDGLLYMVQLFRGPTETTQKVHETLARSMIDLGDLPEHDETSLSEDDDDEDYELRSMGSVTE